MCIFFKYASDNIHQNYYQCVFLSSVYFSNSFQRNSCDLYGNSYSNLFHHICKWSTLLLFLYTLQWSFEYFTETCSFFELHGMKGMYRFCLQIDKFSKCSVKLRSYSNTTRSYVKSSVTFQWRTCLLSEGNWMNRSKLMLIWVQKCMKFLMKGWFQSHPSFPPKFSFFIQFCHIYLCVMLEVFGCVTF